MNYYNVRMDLVRLLVTAQDDRDEAFQASQQALAQMERDDPVKFINDLLGVLNPPNDQRPAVFLALVLLQHAFQGQIIEYSPEHSFLESRLGPETDARILDTTLSFFVNPYTPIRNMAVSLFCSVASTQTKRPDLRLKERLLTFLERRRDFRVYGCHDEALQAGVLSFAPVEGDCETLCAQLAEAGFALRGGYHCAPFAHRTAGTLEGGTVRFSASAFNTMEETAALCRRLGQGGPPKTAEEKFTIS